MDEYRITRVSWSMMTTYKKVNKHDTLTECHSQIMPPFLTIHTSRITSMQGIDYKNQ